MGDSRTEDARLVAVKTTDVLAGDGSAQTVNGKAWSARGRGTVPGDSSAVSQGQRVSPALAAEPWCSPWPASLRGCHEGRR